MKAWSPIGWKAGAGILGLAVFLVVFGRMCSWDVANQELTRFDDTIPVLVYAGRKDGFIGTTRQSRRTQTYLMLPTSWAIPFAVTVEDQDGTLSVDVDRHATLKFLVIACVVAPLVQRVNQRLKALSGTTA